MEPYDFKEQYASLKEKCQKDLESNTRKYILGDFIKGDRPLTT